MQNIVQGQTIDNRLSLFIGYSFLLVAINRVATLPFISNYQNVIALVQWAVYFFLFFRCLKYVQKRSNKLFVRCYVISILLYLWSIIYSFFRGMPVDLIISHEIVWTLLYFIPVGIAVYSVENYKILYDSLYRISYPIALLCIFYCVYRLYINPFGSSYDMAFGYILLVPTLLHCSELKNNRSILLLILILIELFYLLIFGSRGVVIGIVSYWFLGAFLRSQSRSGKAKIIISVLAVVFAFNQLPRINDFLEDHNIYSRTLMKLASGDADDDTHGRMNHWDVGLDLVKQQPLIGYGLGGYYYDFHHAIGIKYSEELYGFDIESGTWVKGGANVSGCHSGFLDMMLFFGVLVGLPLALWLLFSVYNLKKVKNTELFELMLLFYCSYIIGNMIVGGGIFTKPGCAIFIFLMYKLKKQPDIVNEVEII